MGFPLLNLKSGSNWSSVIRRTYKATPILNKKGQYKPIPPQKLSASSRILLAGSQNPDTKPNWYLGGYLSQNIRYSPGSLSSTFETGRAAIPLNKLALIMFPAIEAQGTFYDLEIQIARWHTQLYVEIWQYNGQDLDSTDELIKNLNLNE